MNTMWKWLPSLGGSLLIAANTFATSPYVLTAPAAGAAWSAPAPALSAEEQQLRPLLERLSQLSQLIERNPQSPQLWQYHLEQADVLLRLAGPSQKKERDSILRMAVDAFYSSALLSPREQPIAWQRLRQLPQRLAQLFPDHPVILYAVLQEIQADCMRVMEQSGGDRVKSEEHRCRRLLQFAQEHPQAAEAPKAILQAAQVRESLGQTEEASRCYQYLVEHFSSDAAARKAGGALWRLGQSHQPLQLELPLLYTSGSSMQNTFNLEELRGKLVVVYFWTSTSEHAAEDFQTLKQVTDRYVGRGLEVVYVNMDADPAQARAFLSGQLTAGVHGYQAGGLEGPIAERYGIQEVPQAFLVGRDGTLLKHSLPVSRLETELAASQPHKH